MLSVSLNKTFPFFLPSLFSRNGLIMELLLSSLIDNVCVCVCVCVFVFQELVDFGALIEQLDE